MSVYNHKPYGILTFEQWHGKYGLGSSRIRGHWLIKNWAKAELFQQGGKYDAIIFQKCYWPGFCAEYGGVKILDVCDPDWYSGMEIKKMIDTCDAVTTSTEALRDSIKEFTDKPVVFIPDRYDLKSSKDKKKVHKGIAKKVCWFGYSHNLPTLDVAINTLKKHNLELIVIHNLRPFYQRAQKNISGLNESGVWDVDMVNEEILKCDFVVLPQDMRPLGKYKSNNKTISSWALGMPVAKTPEDVERFMDPEERKKEADIRLKEVIEKWDVKNSVKEYEQLIDTIKKDKK